MDYLIQEGIKAERLRYKGIGSREPKANNDTDEGKSENRRVEFKVLKK